VFVYRIFRLKEAARQQFRWAPHTSGLSTAKPKDYDPGETVEAESPYALWLSRKDSADQMYPGDILEAVNGELCIYKYIGFEPVQWHIPDLKPTGDSKGPKGDD
jgi:hypothetical protein